MGWRAYEKERDRLDKALESGRISREEYDDEMRYLDQQERAEIEEEERNAVERVRDEWGVR